MLGRGEGKLRAKDVSVVRKFARVPKPKVIDRACVQNPKTRACSQASSLET